MQQPQELGSGVGALNTVVPSDYALIRSPQPGLILAECDVLATPTKEQGPKSFAPSKDMPIRRVLYSSVFLAVIQSAQLSWSISQLNLATFNDPEDCATRPVSPHSCLMFPGHSQSQWTWVVNLLSAGALLGSLACGRLADAYGRKTTLRVNAGVMILGAAIQTAAPSLWVFATGRFIAGLASGAASTLPSSYINEISPPHLRNQLGAMYGVSVSAGLVVPVVLFFIADTSLGWRFIAAMPALFAMFSWFGSYKWMVESPTWLLAQGRREEATEELSRLYGHQTVPLALSWINDRDSSTRTDLESADPLVSASVQPRQGLFSRLYRQQTLVAIGLNVAQQFAGINAVFFYSSSMFKAAGVEDDRVGSLIANLFNLIPTLFAGSLGARFGNRRMIVCGQACMLVCSVGYTAALMCDSASLSVIFTALYVAAYSVSLGPLIFIVCAAVFPDHLRASGMSLCLFVNWLGVLTVGVGYPYIGQALGDLGFVPFAIMLSLTLTCSARFVPETAGKTSEEIQAEFTGRTRLLFPGAEAQSVK